MAIKCGLIRANEFAKSGLVYAALLVTPVQRSRCRKACQTNRALRIFRGYRRTFEHGARAEAMHGT